MFEYCKVFNFCKVLSYKKGTPKLTDINQNHIIIVQGNFRAQPRTSQLTFKCKGPAGEYFRLCKINSLDLCCRLLNSTVVVQMQLQTLSKLVFQ